MSTLTKEQIGLLAPKQQEDLAALELGRVAKRQRLLKSARGSKILLGVQGVCMAVVLFLAFLAISNHSTTPLVFALALLVGMSYGQTIATHRRIDALFELYEREDDDAA
jgi:uncharacterized membrane protein